MLCGADVPDGVQSVRVVRSAGPDGIWLSPDDINSWE